MHRLLPKHGLDYDFFGCVIYVLYNLGFSINM